MNQRIRELVVESGNGQMHDGRLYPHIGSRTEADWAKFAELIVRECAGICEKDKKGFPNSDSVKQGLADMIKQHFGVEE